MKATLQNYAEKKPLIIQRLKPQMILKRVASGDKSAVEDCINAYGSVIWALAKKSTDTTEEAENVVLEIFRDLWKCAERFDASEWEEINLVALIARRRLNMHREKICDE